MAVLVPEDLDDLITASTAAEEFGCTVEAILNWVRRGKLEPKGIDQRGRKMYKRIDVLRAERDTRQRALGGRGVPRR